MTRTWIERLSLRPDRVAVLDGQTRPSAVRAAFHLAGIREGAIVLIDCVPQRSATGDYMSTGNSPNSPRRRWIPGRRI